MQQKDIYTIRQLLPDDVAMYKAMRLEALRLEPGMFGNSYALESDYSEEQWMERISNPKAAIFGLYHQQELVGITAIIIDKNQAEEAYMTQSYIRAVHRGRGLSKLLYKARLDWAKRHQLKRLEIGHRESNVVSKAANQRHGFRFSHRSSRAWPDGTSEDMLYYTLEL